MDKIACPICGKLFDTQRSCNGHLKVHLDDYEEIKQRQIETSRRKAKERYEKLKAEYNLNPHKCLACGKPLDYDRAIKRRSKCCSYSCAVRWGNLHKKPRTEESKRKTSECLKKYYKDHPPETLSTIKGPRITPPKTWVCCECGKEFKRKRVHKDKCYCSHDCGRKAARRKRMEKIIKDGCLNFVARWNLEYDNKNYRCDSLLEAASIIWLIDNKKALNLKRSELVLNFKSADGKQHSYNPDFEADFDGYHWIIEVKQNANHVPTKTLMWQRYLSFWEEKKNILEKYSSENNYKWLWLSPDNNKALKDIYRSIQKDKTIYKLTKINTASSKTELK